MARRRHKKQVKVEKDEAPPPARPGVFLRFQHILTTLVILLLIAYGGFHLVARTDGFKSLVREKLTQPLSLPVTFRSISTDWAMNITLSQLEVGAAAGDSSQGGHVEAREVEIRWHPVKSLLRGRLQVEGIGVRDGRVIFTRDAQGRWDPPGLGGMGDGVAQWLDLKLPPPQAGGGGETALPEANQAPAAGPDKTGEQRWNRIRWKLEHCAMRWSGPAGEPVAELDDLDLSVTPVELPNREMRHYLLRLKSADSVSGLHLRNVALELIDAGTQQVVLSFQADGLPGKPLISD